MSRRRSIVRCGNCGTPYDASGGDPRCPACNQAYHPGESLPLLPLASGDSPRNLEEPHFFSDENDKEPETAPLSEFIAAGIVLGAFILMIVAVFVGSPFLLMFSLGVLGGSAIIFGVARLRNVLRTRGRSDYGDDGANLLSWLLGRGYWDSRR
jgi:F0F1-type ATP synthase assembly protein I